VDERAADRRLQTITLRKPACVTLASPTTIS
jgi:hypothetical protein